MDRILRQRAEMLLKIHEGKCSVYGDSDMANTFREMQVLGLVSIEPSIDLDSGMLDIREIDSK